MHFDKKDIELYLHGVWDAIDAGKYQFKIEQRMPITPLVGVKELTLLNNEK